MISCHISVTINKAFNVRRMRKKHEGMKDVSRCSMISCHISVTINKAFNVRRMRKKQEGIKDVSRCTVISCHISVTINKTFKVRRMRKNKNESKVYQGALFNHATYLMILLMQFVNCKFVALEYLQCLMYGSSKDITDSIFILGKKPQRTH